MPKYFLLITSQVTGSNKLQKAILDHFERFNNVLTSDPKAIKGRLESFVDQSCRTFHRCTPQRLQATHSQKTNEISRMHCGGLVTLSVFLVQKEMHLEQLEPTTEPEQTPPPVVNRATAPEPTPAPEAAPDSLPRAVIYTKREGYDEERLECWTKFSDVVQQLLKKGAIWRVYLDSDRKTIAEEYGGVTRFAYL